MRVKVLSKPDAGQRTGDWKVYKGGRKVSSHRTKRKAIEKGRKVARGAGATLVVQNTQGQFRTEASY